MAKRRTKEQKILTALRKLQSNQPISSPTTVSQTRESVSVTGIPKFVSSHNYSTIDYAYVKKDLLKILILMMLAIGIQIVLSFLISNNVSVIPSWLRLGALSK